MSDIINRLYDSRNINNYKSVDNKEIKLIEELTAVLSKNDIDKLNNLIDLISETDETNSQDSYMQGLKDGFNLCRSLK